jgi:clan AA aspartic protease (TIGR02281 family)
MSDRLHARRPVRAALVATGLAFAAAASPQTGQVVAAPTATPAAAPAGAAAGPASQPSAAGADVLAAKDLNKVGPIFALKAERDLIDGVRELAKAKAKMDADNRGREAIEREITKAKNVYAQFEAERRVDLERLAKAKQADVVGYNQIVARVNSAADKMKQAMEYKEENETKLRKLGDDARAKYIQLVLELADAGDKTDAKYAELAKDKAVTDAVTAAKAKLGPTPEFKQQFNFVKKLRAPVFAETVPVKYEGKVPMVEVTLNGSTLKKMILDTGASYVSIPASLATAMELIPAKDDPEITLQLADGKLVKARKSTLKSVRVGKFTIENVECAILPAELVAAEPCLGGSFLNNFTFKLDTGKEQLHLAKIGGNDPTKDPKKDPKKPAAAAGK